MTGRLRRVLGRVLPRRRRSRLLSGLDRRLMVLHELFHNLNYDFEHNGESWVARVLKAGGLDGVYLDVGANVGDWALCVEAICAPRVIHCFEPIPETFAKLVANTAKSPSIVCRNLGLSDAAGELSFAYSDRLDVLSSALPDIFSHIHHLDFEERRCGVTTGDAFCADEGLEVVDFLKVDTEGYEGAVLAGFRRMIAEDRIRVIQFEYGMGSIYSGYLLRHLYDQLSPKYLIGKIYPNFVDFKDYHTKDEDFLGPNYLAVARGEDLLIERLSG
jgi:FkbM family methyltransferase